MDWYYAAGKERKGPVSETQVAQLVASGEIKSETMVWNQTMPNWQPATAAGLYSKTTATPGQQICIVTGKSFPESFMIHTEHGWVSGEGKDVYYQSLREGVGIPLADNQTNARSDGKKIVVPVVGAKFPARCVKTNTTVSSEEFQKKKLYWASPWVTLTILINLLVCLILYMVLRKKVELDIPVSRAGRAVLRKHRRIATGIFFAGVGVVIAGGFAIDANGSSGALLLVLGVLVALGGLVYASARGALLRVIKIKDGKAWLSGACPELVNSLPPL